MRTLVRGEGHKMPTSHKAGWLTRPGATVRRRQAAFWPSATIGPRLPSCGLLTGNFLPHWPTAAARRAAPRRRGSTTIFFGSPAAAGVPIRERCDRGGVVWPAGVCRHKERPHPAWEEASMRTDLQSLLLGGLLVAVIALGYLYWERQRNTVEIKLPSITIEKH
jgi:hypothetical protein